MSRYLDDLGRTARDSTRSEPPDRQWLERRRTQRRKRRWLVGAGCVGTVLVAGLAGFGAMDSQQQTVTVADGSESDSEVDGAVPTTAQAPATSGQRTPPTDADRGSDQAEGRDSPVGECGAWPTGIQLWPDDAAQPGLDTIEEDGQFVRRQSFLEFTLEVYWPPTPREEYDFDYAPPGPAPRWVTGSDDVFRVGFDPTGASEPLPGDNPEQEPGLSLVEIDGTATDVMGLVGRCAKFEIRLLEGGQMIDRSGFGVESMNEPLEVTSDESHSFSFARGLAWLELGPLVTEQRSVTSIPPSVLCGGVLVDQDTTTYRLVEPLASDLTIEGAVTGGRLTEVEDPLTESKEADPTEPWGVLMPGAEPGATIAELEQLGQFFVIEAADYESFVDPETGPTSGPGVSGSHERPIDALQAFFEHPAAETFIKTGLVELTVDEATVAYGVPMGHGEDGWITVITTELVDDGWLVSGWTSAGC